MFSHLLSPSFLSSSIIDTGTTYTYVPTRIAKQLYEKLGFEIKKVDTDGTNFLLYGLCNGEEAPQLVINIGEPPAPFIISSRNAGDLYARDCRLSIIGDSRLDEHPVAILGTNFLKNIHLVVDRGLYKMGFAQRIISPDEYKP